MLAATLPFTKGWALCHTPANPMSSSSRSFIVHRRRRDTRRESVTFHSSEAWVRFFGGKISWEILPILILLEGEGGRGGSRSRSRSRGRGSGRGA